MSLKAQPQESRHFPPAPPPHFRRQKPRAGMHAPAPARERRKHGQAGQKAQQPQASPAAVHFPSPLPPHNLASSRLYPTIEVITTQGSDLAHVCCLLNRWYGEKREGVEKTTGFRHWLMQSDAGLALKDRRAFRRTEL